MFCFKALKNSQSCPIIRYFIDSNVLGDNAPPKLVPKTIESMRESDETTVKPTSAPEVEQDEEVNWDIANDEFKDYFDKSYVPKVLITTGDNPHSVSIFYELQSRSKLDILLLFESLKQMYICRTSRTGWVSALQKYP